MRVIAGEARRLLLKPPAGLETRPTSDKIKETLFNILMPDLMQCTFLDLFSGSGGIGIEALSRGAKEAVFVERYKSAIQCIEENLVTTKMQDRARVFKTDVMTALRQMEGRYQFDIIFMDPPYEHDLEKEVLYYLKDSSLVHDGTMIIMETSERTDVSYVNDDASLCMELYRTKKYKSNAHHFIRVIKEEQEA